MSYQFKIPVQIIIERVAQLPLLLPREGRIGMAVFEELPLAEAARDEVDPGAEIRPLWSQLELCRIVDHYRSTHGVTHVALNVRLDDRDSGSWIPTELLGT